METDDSFCPISPNNQFLDNISVEFESEDDKTVIIGCDQSQDNNYHSCESIQDLQNIEKVIDNCLSDNEFDINVDNNDSDLEIVTQSKDNLLLGSELLKNKFKSNIDVHKECKTRTLREKQLRIQLQQELELERQQRIQFQNQLQEYMQSSLQRQFDDNKQIKELKFELLKCKQQLIVFKKSHNFNNNNNIDLSSSVSKRVCHKNYDCIDCQCSMKSEVSLILHIINHSVEEQDFYLSTNFFKLDDFDDSIIDSVRRSVSYVCPRCTLSFNCVDIYRHIYLNHTKERPLICNSCKIYCTHLDYLRAHHQNAHDGIVQTISYANITTNNKSQNNLRSQITKPYNNGINSSNTFRPINSYDIRLSNRLESLNPSANSSSSDANHKSSISSSDNGSDDPEIINLSDSPTPSSQISSQIHASCSSKVVSQEEFECTFADCEFKTTSSDKLNFHFTAHTQSKFKCPYCPYVGNVLNDIFRHIQKSKKHEGLKIYECRECKSFETNCSSSFREHLYKKHFFDDSDEDQDITEYITNMFRNEHNKDQNS